MFFNSPESFQVFGVLFVTENFQKSPNLVTTILIICIQTVDFLPRVLASLTGHTLSQSKDVIKKTIQDPLKQIL